MIDWQKYYPAFKRKYVSYFAHAFLGQAIAYFAILVMFNVNEYLLYMGSLLASLLIAIFIERIDDKITGKFDIGDIISTLIGNAMLLGLYQYVS